LALSKAISRQDRGGGDFGFAVERHFATARRDAGSAALKQFAGRVVVAPERPDTVRVLRELR
jgi:hypothetical protein